jgi:nitrogen fixation/metabolism regulation signal transduction histidine kinase
MTRTLRYTLVIVGGVVSILLFLLSSASENTDLFDQHYPTLLAFNAAVAVVLLILVIWLLLRMYKGYRRGKFGYKLLARLVLLFAMIGILPGAAIYLVSMQFVSRSIDSWFDVKTEAALESGLTLGKNALDASLNDLLARARSMAQELGDLSEAERITYMTHLHNQQMEASIVTANGQILSTFGNSIRQLVPSLPTPAMLRQARQSRGFATVESDDSSYSSTTSSTNLRLHVVVELPNSRSNGGLNPEPRFLQILQPVPEYLANNAETLRQTYSEYQQRSVARTGLRKIYLVTLTLTLLLAIFSAIACAFLIARDLAKPLLLLAAGTKAVAEGNLSPRPIVSTSDELGTLTQSFNTMTRQLLEARIAVDKNRAELEQAKAYLESVLDNMSAGVIVLDKEFRLVTSNDSVERILGYNLTTHIGEPLHTIAGQERFAEAVIKAFSEQQAQLATTATAHDDLRWQQQIEIPRQQHVNDYDNDNLILFARGSHLPVDDGVGYVIVFDNITEVISAQRSVAWGEVVRRLAHEIKNPLTPIQLSAERLQMRLADKLAPADAAILDKSTTTIVNQVTSMKHMVDDFRNYAQLPPTKLAPLDLNELTAEILHLYLAGDGRDIIHFRLDPQLPKIMGDATQLRQVIHNLLQNAQDAVADNTDPPPRVDVTTELVQYQGAAGETHQAVRLSILDNGSGFAQKILSRAFEPYVTSKPRGTGLGLPMVKKIIDEHAGRIDIQNRTDISGAKVLVLLSKLAL